jgi:hypothetical protein
MTFLTQTKGNLAETVIITLIFFAENWQKSQKIEIITPVPGAVQSIFLRN